MSKNTFKINKITITALEITVGHRTLSGPKLKMSDQNQTQPDIMSNQIISLILPIQIKNKK